MDKVELRLWAEIISAHNQRFGNYPKVEPLYQWVLGVKHPGTLQSVNNLAALYQSQGRYEAARPVSERAWQGFEKVLGKNHPNTQKVREIYVDLLSTDGGDYAAS